MEIFYKNHNVGSLGMVGTSYVFTIKTKKTHAATEFTSKNLQTAIKKCDKICEELAGSKK